MLWVGVAVLGWREATTGQSAFLALTPADVIAMLGFDPLLYKEDEDEGNG